MERNTAKAKIYKFFEKNFLVVVMLIMAVVMTFVNSNFLTLSNFINVLRNMAVTGVMACGMTMLMVSGDFDLSFGSTLGLSTCVVPFTCERFVSAGMNITAGCLLGMLLSFGLAGLFGCLNGYFVTRWNLPAMLVTIAMQYFIYGVAGSLTGGFPQYTLPGWYGFFGRGMVGGLIPVSVIILLILMVFFYILLAKTKFGRTMYVVGGNKESARLAGINVKRYKVIAFVVMQLTACLAGIIFGSQLAGGSQSYGKGMEFTVVAAVIIGGISLYGGSGSVKDTFIGLLFLNLIINAMTIANLSEYAQYIVRGTIMIAAILISEYQHRVVVKRRIKIAQEMTEKLEAEEGVQ